MNNITKQKLANNGGNVHDAYKANASRLTTEQKRQMNGDQEILNVFVILAIIIVLFFLGRGIVLNTMDSVMDASVQRTVESVEDYIATHPDTDDVRDAPVYGSGVDMVDVYGTADSYEVEVVRLGQHFRVSGYNSDTDTHWTCTDYYC